MVESAGENWTFIPKRMLILGVGSCAGNCTDLPPPRKWSGTQDSLRETAAIHPGSVTGLTRRLFALFTFVFIFVPTPSWRKLPLHGGVARLVAVMPAV